MTLIVQEKTYLRLMPTTHLQVLRESIAMELVLASEDTRRVIDETLAERGKLQTLEIRQ